MAAVLSPPHPLPGLSAFPRRAPRRHLQPVPPRGVTTGPTVGRPAARLVTVRTAAPCSAATYARRRAVALLVLLLVSLPTQLVASQLVASVVTRVVATAHPAVAAAEPVAGGAAPGAAPAREVPAEKVYVVRSGDTLWSIAQRLHPDADPRPLVDALAERAGSAALRPGQRIDLDGLAL